MRPARQATLTVKVLLCTALGSLRIMKLQHVYMGLQHGLPQWLSPVLQIILASLALACFRRRKGYSTQRMWRAVSDCRAYLQEDSLLISLSPRLQTPATSLSDMQSYTACQR